MKRELIRLALEGAQAEGPEDLDISELAKLLLGIRKTAKALLEDLQLKEPDGPLLSLAKIESGSIALELSSSASTASAMQRKVLDPLALNQLDSIPSNTYQRLRELDKELREKNLKLSYVQNNESKILLDPSRPLPEKTPVRTRSIIYYYGRVTDIGGKKPKVDIESLVDKHIYHLQASIEVVKELEKMQALYEVVGLEVEVERILEEDQWITRPNKVIGVLSYKRTPAKQALKTLAEKLRYHWNNVDLDDYMKKLRG